MRMQNRALWQVGAAACAIALAVLPILTAEASAQRQINLEEAIRLASGRSPALAQSRGQVITAEQTRRTTFGAFLPTASASTSFSKVPTSERLNEENELVRVSNGESMSASFSSGLTLFQGGSRFANIRGSQADLGAAEANYRNQEFSVELQTKTFFFNALEQQDLLDVSEQNVRRAEESLEFSRANALNGRGTRSDTLRARLELKNAQLALLRSQDATRASRLALGRQVGVDEPVSPVTPDDLDPSPLSLTYEEIIGLAENGSPSVIAAVASTDAAEVSVTVAKTAYLPTANLSGSYSFSNNSYSFSDMTSNWRLGLSLSYNIFNGFSRESSLARASDGLRVANLQEEDARLAAREEAENAYWALQTSVEAIQIAQESLTVAEEDFRVVQERYSVSVATILDVTTSQIAVTQAAQALVAARYDYIIARAQLEAILGRPL